MAQSSDKSLNCVLKLKKVILSARCKGARIKEIEMPTTYNVVLVDGNVLKMSFGVQAQNDVIVRDAVAAVKALGLRVAS